MNADRPDFPIDRLGFTAPDSLDPVVAALVAHQRHTVSHCLCGWSVLGASHAEHVAGIIRPLIARDIEAKVRERIALALEERAAAFDKRALGKPYPWARPEHQTPLLIEAGTYERAAAIARGNL